MLIQVVHAHPLTDSYNHALFQATVETLREQGHEVIATDLYRMGFQPAMTEAERGSYYQGSYDASGIAELADVLRRIDGLILVYPHWWFSMPAMMKGYIDRVWGPGIAFDHDQEGGRIQPLLGNIRHFGVITSYGSPWWVVRFLMGDPGRRVTMRALKALCGPKVRSFFWAHYDMDRSTDASRSAFLNKVRRRLAKL